MIIKTVEFLVSNTNPKKCPPPDLPEYAFIGRSNVGKSSLINMLVSRKGLAKTSSTPGKTQLINHFIVNNQWYLVDLPGYGYARTGKKNKEAWKKMIVDYIRLRENIVSLFVLIDCRIPPQKIDIEFINFLGTNGVPFVLIYTKADKISALKTQQALEEMKNALSAYWDEMPDMMISSSENGLGKEEILKFIEKANKNFQ